MEYRADNKILYRHHSVSSENDSADTCFLYLIDKILTGFDSSFLIRMITVDLQKAFDTNNHDLLLLKKCLPLNF